MVINDGVVEALNIFLKKVFIIRYHQPEWCGKETYTVDDVNAVHQYMQKVFNKAGVSITDFYFCPHHPDVSKCLCRKPDSLLIEKAAARYRVDLSKSFFIGDSSRDIEAAAKAGVKGFLINANESILPIAKKICAS